jgi:hypothetical protein
VWHELTKDAVARGELVVLGVTQEQHPDRCRLFAQWKDLDFPIFWDPFNLTATKVVPRALGFDEYGVLVADGLSHRDWEERLLNRSFSPPEDAVAIPESPGNPSLAVTDWIEDGRILPASDTPAALVHREYTIEWRARPMSALLWGPPARWSDSLRTLEAAAGGKGYGPLARFQLGVAYRMRYDSLFAQPGDFQAAVDHWSTALASDPSQYIWRRRLQQYGPRLDKPYPFYDWVEEARAEILARGDTPVALPVALSGAERATPAKGLAQAEAGTPPEGADGIPRDEGDWLVVETAVVFDTSHGEPVARVHIALRPRLARKVHWNNEVEPTLLWVGDPDLPDGFEADARRLVAEHPATATSLETRSFDFELRPPEGGGTLRGYVLFYACEDTDGECVYLRRDFDVAVTPPGDS